MPQRRLPRLNQPLSRPSLEQLEDRTTPTVTAVQDGTGLLTVTLSAASDSATITGTDASGTSIDVLDNVNNTTQSFTDVTGITVLDGGTNLTQSVTFNDGGATDAINLTGAISVTGIESVDFDTADAALQADSVAVSGAATAIRFDTSVTTGGTGGQSYDGPAVVGAATVTLSAGAGGITFTQTVNSDTGLSNNLVLNSGGTTNLTGIIGGVQALGSLTTDAPGTTEIGANVVTTGAQTFNDPAILTGTTIALESTTNGNVSFGSTLNANTTGANSLVVNTGGATIFTGVVGANTALGGITTDSAGTTQIDAGITTVGAQTYNDPVVLSGATIVLASTASSNIQFSSTLDDAAAAPGTTALTINTATGTTTFGGSVGAAEPLASITTDAGTGNTIIGSNASSTISVNTTGAQTYNDPVRINALTATVASTQNGNITFASTLNGNSASEVDVTFNSGGKTIFTGAVGGVQSLTSITTVDAGQVGEGTTIENSVTTSGTQNYGNSVTFAPATGVTSQTLTSSLGNIAFGKTFGGTSAAPVTIHAGANVSFGGNATFSGAGSRLNVQAGAEGSGAISIAAGLTFTADVQTWQAGDGSGSGTTSVLDLVTNAPSFRDSTGTKAPLSFVLRQDASITDATIPAFGQFGTAPPQNYTIISDAGSITFDTSSALAADLAAPGTTSLTLGSSLSLSLGTTLNAPGATVRLSSTTADVTQTAGGITAAGLGARAASSVTLTGTNAVTGSFAAAAATSNIQFTNGAAYTVGAIGADPLGVIFSATTGVVAATGTVAFTQPGSSPLTLTIAAPVSGTTVTATGGSGNDTVTVNYTSGATLAKGLIFNGNGGSDTLALNDAGSAAAHTYTLGATAVRDGAAAISFSNLETLSVTGGTAADTFNITPNAATAITATGGAPSGTTGDTLALTLTGAASPNLSATSSANGFSGSATFANLATVSFSQMESITPQADLQVASSSAAAFIPVGGSTIITVVVTNAGPAAVTGATITDLLPTGITGTWTATASSGSSVAASSGSGNINTTASLAANGTVTFTITVTTSTGFLGSVTNTVTVSAASSAFDTNTANNQGSSSFTVEAAALLAVGAGAGGGPQVKVFNADGSLRFNFFAYDPAYLGGVTVATGDLNGDGVEDIVTGSAEGSSHVEVFDGSTGNMLASFFAFPGFNGGVNVAVANGEVIVGAGPGGGPIFSGFSIAHGLTQTFSMFAFDPAFRGGVTVGGSANLISVGAGPGGGPNVKVFDASTLALVTSFYAFQPDQTSGVSIGMGTSNGRDTVIVGAGPGSSPTVATFDAQTGGTVSAVQAFNPSFLGGVRTASTTTPSGEAGTVVGAGPGGSPRVRVIGSDGTTALDFFAFDPSFTGGVYVG